MIEFDTILQNAFINGAFICDIGIKNGIITAIGMSLTVSEETNVIDCNFAVVTPGGIDGHVHLAQDKSVRAKQAGYVCADTSEFPIKMPLIYAHKGTVETGTRSAVAGGTTTVLLFAEQSRGDSLRQKVEEYHTLARQQGSYADYGFHAIITDPTETVLEEELPELAEAGIMSIKLFLTYAHMRISDKQFLRCLHKARQLDMVTLVHAENGDLVDFFTEMLESKGLTDPMFKAVAHPPSAEAEATNRAVTFSSIMDTPLLIVHVSVPESTKVIRKAQESLQPIFAETCPQYLLLGKSNLEKEHFCGAKFICSPPLRSDPKDIDAIWQGLINGTFTIFSSDHCPYRFNDPCGKQLGLSRADNGNPNGMFTKIPNGLPGVETRLPLLFSEGVLRRRCIDVKRFVELTSENPAKLYGLYPKKGAIQVGSDADIVVWHNSDCFTPKILNHDRDLHDGCDYSPYEGIEFLNWPRITMLRGRVMFQDGKTVGQNGYGTFVRRQKCKMPLMRKMQGEWDVLRAAI